MKKHFIIDLIVAGAMAACVLGGCGKQSPRYCTTGMTKIENHDYEGAIEEFNEEISKDSGNRDAYRGLGIAYYRLGNMKLAKDNFKIVIDKSGNKYDDIHLDSMKYYAECLAGSGDYDSAVQYYSVLISKCDKEEKADFYYLRGCAYIHLNDENNAALDFEKSLECEDGNYSTYCNMYNAFMNSGYVDRAESYLRRLINAEDADAMLIGKTYFALGNYDLAEQYLEEAYDDGESEASYYLAMNYEKHEKYTEADNFYISYMNKHPEDPNIYNQYGAFLINMKNYETALSYIEKGLEKADKDSERALLYNEAICYEYMGDYDKAYELFESYVAKYPEDKSAKKEYEFLKTR